MKEMRAEMKGMAGELRQKEARLKYLLKEFAKLPKSVNRILYTSRIMAIIDKVRKQNLEIDRVIEQIHDVQKDINEVGQKLLRTEKRPITECFKLPHNPRIVLTWMRTDI